MRGAGRGGLDGLVVVMVVVAVVTATTTAAVGGWRNRAVEGSWDSVRARVAVLLAAAFFLLLFVR